MDKGFVSVHQHAVAQPADGNRYRVVLEDRHEAGFALLISQKYRFSQQPSNTAVTST
jgi:hypothetical protein